MDENLALTTNIVVHEMILLPLSFAWCVIIFSLADVSVNCLGQIVVTKILTIVQLFDMSLLLGWFPLQF